MKHKDTHLVGWALIFKMIFMQLNIKFNELMFLKP